MRLTLLLAILTLAACGREAATPPSPTSAASGPAASGHAGPGLAEVMRTIEARDRGYTGPMVDQSARNIDPFGAFRWGRAGLARGVAERETAIAAGLTPQTYEQAVRARHAEDFVEIQRREGDPLFGFEAALCAARAVIAAQAGEITPFEGSQQSQAWMARYWGEYTMAAEFVESRHLGIKATLQPEEVFTYYALALPGLRDDMAATPAGGREEMCDWIEPPAADDGS